MPWAVASLPAGGELYLWTDWLCVHIPNSLKKEILIKQKAEEHCSIPDLKSPYLHMNSWQDILISILMARNGKKKKKQKKKNTCVERTEKNSMYKNKNSPINLFYRLSVRQKLN